MAMAKIMKARAAWHGIISSAASSISSIIVNKQASAHEKWQRERVAWNINSGINMASWRSIASAKHQHRNQHGIEKAKSEKRKMKESENGERRNEENDNGMKSGNENERKKENRNESVISVMKIIANIS